MSWPIRMRLLPVSRCKRPSVPITWRCVTTSRALVGSSAMISCGRSSIADRDADALLHPAAQLVRIEPCRLRRQIDTCQRLRDHALNGAAIARAVMIRRCFAQLLADCRDRVQRIHRALRDVADQAQARGTQRLRPERTQIGPVEQHASGGDAPWRPQQAEDRRAPWSTCRNRIPRPGRAVRPAAPSGSPHPRRAPAARPRPDTRP